MINARFAPCAPSSQPNASVNREGDSRVACRDGGEMAFAEAMDAEDDGSSSAPVSRGSGSATGFPEAPSFSNLPLSPVLLSEPESGQPNVTTDVATVPEACVSVVPDSLLALIAMQVNPGRGAPNTGSAAGQASCPPPQCEDVVRSAALTQIDIGLPAGFAGTSGVLVSAGVGALQPPDLRAAALKEPDGFSQSLPGAGIAGAESGAAARLPAQPGSSASSTPAELRSHVGTAGWADDLGARVTWMLDRGEQIASLQLNPENLGPVEVRVAVREGETTVWFGAPHADTRAALEQALPRLREMLGSAGLSLANAGVFSHSPRNPQRGFTTADLARADHESGSERIGETLVSSSLRGLVDLYA